MKKTFFQKKKKSLGNLNSGETSNLEAIGNEFSLHLKLALEKLSSDV